MTTTSTAFWRQSVLPILAFVLGSAATFCWLELSGIVLAPPVDLPTTSIELHAPTASAWHANLSPIAIAALLATVVGIGTWLQIGGQKQRFAMPRLNDLSFRARSHSTNSTHVEEIREQVERKLADLVGYVAQYLDTTTDQAKFFAIAQTKLDGAGTVEQVQAVIKLLIANNADARQSADDLRARLIKANTESAKLKASLRQAVTAATIDGLTNLANRRHFQDCLEAHVRACHGEHTPLCLVMADLDHFKSVNDKHGHLSGDAVLKSFASILSNGIRENDIAARYGGEEFALILPKTTLGSASVIAESLRRRVAENRWVGANPSQRVGTVTSSFGVAEIRDSETAAQLLERADQKLYEAKRKGRNQVALDHTFETCQ